MSSSSSSATAPGSLLADGQLGARPKNSRQLVANGQSTREKPLAPLNFNPSSTPSSTNKEWNSNWNSVLSFQEKDCSRRKMMNGQPPSVNSSANAGSRMMSISRGSSDPSLAIQPVSTSHLQYRQQQQQQHQEKEKKKEKKKEKSSSSLEFYHCQSGSYQTRQLGLQGDRPSVNASRSSSAADLSRSYSSIAGSSLGSNNSNSLNNIQDPASLSANTNSGTGITSIWWRWFRRNNNNNNRHRRRAVTGPVIGPSSSASPASRSQSAENSPVINRRSSNLVGKSSLAAGEKFKQSDSLSTDSFAFIRPSISSGRQQSTIDDDMMIMTASQQQLNHPMALRIKYGLLYSAGSAERVHQPLEDNQMEGEAIRAMRTRWELQMRQVESGQQQLEQQQQQESSASATTTTSRKKRPAPQPPVATSSPCPSSSVQSWSRSLVQSTNSQPTAVASRSSLASNNGRFAHVPGKRKAPSPPPLPQQQQQQQQQTTSNTDGLNIPPAPPAQALTTRSDSKTLNSPSSSNSRNIQTGQEQQVFRPRPTSFRIHQTDFDSDFDQPIERTATTATATATTLLLEKNKWTNDLNSNLMDANAERMTEEKSIRYHQNKINNGHRHQGPSCPHNDILKLEGGLLRPLDPTSPVTTTNKETPASTMSSVDTSAHRMTLPLKPWYKRHHSSSSASSHHHPHPHHQHPPRSKWKDAALIHPPRSPDEGLCWRATAASPAVSPESTLTVSTISSPGGSTRSGGSSSDGSKKRKSLLVNISQLDREAAEIIQRERARESQRKKMQDDKFYSIGQHQLELPVVLESAQSTYKEKTDHGPSKGTKELIDMFNSLSGPVGWAIAADEAIDSQGAESMDQQGLCQGQGQQHANSNNKTLASQEQRSSNPVNAPADAASSCPSESLTSIPSPTTTSNSNNTNNTNNTNTITRLRVNRTTVETPVQSLSKEPASIFIPKFERKIDSPLVQPRPSLPVVEYTGGARPKKSSVLLDPAPPATPRLVNGPEEPADKCPAISGWACHVCTLVNSDARLWCEACTALKPRRPVLTTSSTSSVPDKAVPDKAASTRSLTQPEMTNENKENRDLSIRLVTASPTKGEKAVVQQPPPSDFIRPSSPEALRQARLAFFLNGLNGPKSQSETTSQSAAVERPRASELDKTPKSQVVQQQQQVRDQTGDKNNNININVKRHSQHGLTGSSGSSNKVSSGCQTVPSQPTLASIKMRPLSEGRMDGRLSSSDSSSTDSRTEEGPVPRSLELSDKRIISPDENNLIGLVDKDKPIRIVKSVNPTDFASSIISPSRTQLSQYLQQRERDRERERDRDRDRDQQLAGSKRRASTQSLDNVETVDSNQNTSTETSDEKRVDILLWRLEESIACGQFDKAAVLAKELAAIKRPATAGQTTWTNNTKPEHQATTAYQPVAAIGINPTSLISKPVAAPRSILPAPVHPPKPAAPLPFVTQQTDHQSSSTIQVQAVQADSRDSTTSPSLDNKNNNNQISPTNAVQSPPPRPAKRHSISNISKEPTPPPKNNVLIRPEEKKIDPPEELQISLLPNTVPAAPVAPINKEETPTVVTVNPVELREPSPAPVTAAIKEEGVPDAVINQIHPVVVPQVSVRAKKSKVSSGQQTTLSYQRKSTAGPPVSSELEPTKNSVKILVNNNNNNNNNGKERSQSCIIDHTFKSLHRGSFDA